MHTINFNNNQTDVYERWGIANSLHVISMANDLIGLPKEMQSYRFGKLDWHPSGDRFVGSGVLPTRISRSPITRTGALLAAGE